MKYKIPVTISGYVEIDAESEQEAIEHVEDGYSLTDVCVEDTQEDTDQIEEVKT